MPPRREATIDACRTSSARTAVGARSITTAEKGLSNRPVGCAHCGFGVSSSCSTTTTPRPGRGSSCATPIGGFWLPVQGVFELTGYRERDLLGHEVTEALELNGAQEQNPAQLAVEWGVRQLDKHMPLRTRSGVVKQVRVDFFPAYDEDGGLLVALTPL